LNNSPCEKTTLVNAPPLKKIILPSDKYYASYTRFLLSTLKFGFCPNFVRKFVIEKKIQSAKKLLLNEQGDKKGSAHERGCSLLNISITLKFESFSQFYFIKQ